MNTHQEPDTNPKKLRRSLSDSLFLGVCSGLARYFRLDPLLMRVIFVAAFFLGLGSPVIIYFILALVMPRG